MEDFDLSFPDLNPDNNERKKKKLGGFQSMNLSQDVLKGIAKRGYKQPTPIQRKAVPLILQGRDVVAMARTGSGKTACFLIPLLEKLKTRIAKAGARALVLSPTRELALQTLKFIKELGRFTTLRPAVILGGDSMEDQFLAIHGNPDIIVATPGRFLHVCIEMELKLNSVEYVVFDEADRLFEMGLGEQLTEIIGRLPDTRQSVLFSATLPKVLVDFAKAGLADPTLIRLDVDSKIPEELQLWFFTVRPEEHLAALLVLLKNCIDKEQQTIVFVATKHHVEYIHAILDKADISNTYIYSNLDPAARKINTAKFCSGKVNVLIVTDLAARGIDIPQLDNVINFNFPAEPKLFVHRVGRCARAGRSGTAYSLVSPDEIAYLLDLHLFLGRPIKLIASKDDKDGTVGKIPQFLLEEECSNLVLFHENNVELESLKKTSENGHQHYLKTRPLASSDSNRNVKELPFNACLNHTIFKDFSQSEDERETFLGKMKSYRPQGTIFEICGKNKSQGYLAMKQKRLLHKRKISEFKTQPFNQSENNKLTHSQLLASTSEDINSTFQNVILPKKRKLENLYKKSKSENYIPYMPDDQFVEKGLQVNNFQSDTSKAALDLTTGKESCKSQTKKWDKKKMKMVSVEDKRKGKIRTESGVWIPATYKSNRYAQWKEKSKFENQDVNETEEPKFKRNTHWARHNEKLKLKQRKSEMKSNDGILKARRLAENKLKKNKKFKKGKKK